jgi:hypothetical protein
MLRPGGLYIIEDLHWQPSSYENSLPRVPKTAQLLTNLDRLAEVNAGSSIDDSSWNALKAQFDSVQAYNSDQLRSKASIPLRRRIRLAMKRARRSVKRSIGMTVSKDDKVIKLVVIKKSLGKSIPS